MSNRSKIGEFRHTPAAMAPGPDGVLRPLRMRRRFPYRGLVVLAYGLIGSLVCAGVSVLFRAAGATKYLPQHLDPKAVAPAPSIDNVLFGAGFYETVLACGLVGYWLWMILWKTRVGKGEQERGFFGVLPALLGQGLWLGPVLAFTAVPIGVFGYYLRVDPAHQPWLVRPLFALLAAPTLLVSSLFTGIVPLVVLILGLLLGVATAVGVALLWQHFPEEPVLK
jgi:hypothetical protein